MHAGRPLALPAETRLQPSKSGVKYTRTQRNSLNSGYGPAREGGKLTHFRLDPSATALRNRWILFVNRFSTPEMGRFLTGNGSIFDRKWVDFWPQFCVDFDPHSWHNCDQTLCYIKVYTIIYKCMQLYKTISILLKLHQLYKNVCNFIKMHAIIKKLCNYNKIDTIVSKFDIELIITLKFVITSITWRSL